MNIKAYYLINETEGEDEYGEVRKQKTERKVYPCVSSIRQSEAYQAQAVGVMLEKTVEIRDFEYKGESKIREDDTIYEISRTFCKEEGKVELVLKRGVNKNVSTKVSNQD